MIKINPTVKELLVDKPDFTVMELWWAGYWRMVVIIMGVSLAMVILGAIFA